MFQPSLNATNDLFILSRNTWWRAKNEAHLLDLVLLSLPKSKTADSITAYRIGAYLQIRSLR